MATYLMFGKYSSQALKGMSIARTDKARELVKQFGGEVDAIYATLGDHDLVIIASLPGTEEAMKASLALTKLTGITFSTTPAVTVEEFDKLTGEV